jgi:hypothetical protein
MSDTPERDLLEALLAPPTPVDAAALRQSLLLQTTRRLRRPRWLRRAALAAALAACYGAGLLSMRLLTPTPPIPSPTVAAVQQPKEDAPQAPAAAVPAVAVELRAARAADPERARLLRQAGERYLNEEIDPEAALRCYSKALDAGSEEDTKFSDRDDWLLMAIKNAREKEARHAN